MKIEKLEYFWGLFDNPDEASPAGAKTHLCFTGDDVPTTVQRSFADERIHELRGEFGIPGVGEPEEISVLDVTAGGEQWQIRVLNHTIVIVHADSPELGRLFRFFCVLRDTISKRSGAS